MTWIIGAWKAFPVALVLAAVELQSLLTWAGVVATLGGVLFIGTVWSAARSYKAQAEALGAENRQLSKTLHEQAARITTLEGRIEELSRRPDLRELRDLLNNQHADLADRLRVVATSMQHFAQTGTWEPHDEPSR